MFDGLIHADWSVGDGKKRQMAVAEPASQGWLVKALQPVPPDFLEKYLLDGKRILAGFDFPIGLPTAYGKQTGFSDFLEALKAFGSGEWTDFFEVAETKEDISIKRPFYPHNPNAGGIKKEHLWSALNAGSMDGLRKRCDRKTLSRNAACPIFWTLGGNQVGKAAINGWQSVVRPALLRGARLWPFDGRLADLSNSTNCVICETYPAEAYGHISEQFPKRGKRKQSVRQDGAKKMIAYAEHYGIEFAAEVKSQLDDGFGEKDSGEDPFDALVGLLSMIAVAQKRRDEGGIRSADELAWEGWILGQASGE